MKVTIVSGLYVLTIPEMFIVVELLDHKTKYRLPECIKQYMAAAQLMLL